MRKAPHTEATEEAYINRHRPQDRFEYVDVTFTAADTDVVIPYTLLRPNNPNDVRWQDVTPSAVYNGSIDVVPSLYCSATPSRKLWSRSYIVLRSSVAGYSTRLLLFTERM